MKDLTTGYMAARLHWDREEEVEKVEKVDEVEEVKGVAEAKLTTCY